MSQQWNPLQDLMVLQDRMNRLFEDATQRHNQAEATAGDGFERADWTPAADIYETDSGYLIAMDLPGVDIDAVRIVAKGNAVLIAGEKTPRRGRGDSSFHLVERAYGRFARVARLTKPCDSKRAQATFTNGELRVSVPKIPDRRGRTTSIPIADARPLA